jgi:hypothetical protein
MAMVKFDSHAHALNASARAVLELSSDSEHVAAAAMLQGMMESRAMQRYQNDDRVEIVGLQDAVPYHPVALIISWNPLGDIVVNVGHSHKVRMTPLVNFGFAATSATATFSDTRLICWALDVVVE